MRTLLLALVALAAPLAGCSIEMQAGFPPFVQLQERSEDASPRILAVIAHPDDETAFAASLYAASRCLGGLCDVVVITNGEGGFKYSTLAQDLYGAELVREEVGREELPDIRRFEMAMACSWLGVHDLAFLDQRDHRYTTDEREVLAQEAGVWDLEAVRSELRPAPGVRPLRVRRLPAADARDPRAPQGGDDPGPRGRRQAAGRGPPRRARSDGRGRRRVHGARSRRAARLADHAPGPDRRTLRVRPSPPLRLPRGPRLAHRRRLGHRRAQVPGHVADDGGPGRARGLLPVRRTGHPTARRGRRSCSSAWPA